MTSSPALQITTQAVGDTTLLGDVSTGVFRPLVPTPRLERGTPRSTIWCSNQLSYVGTQPRCTVATR